MKRKMLAIAVAASCLFAVQTQNAEAKSYPALLDNVLKGAVDAVDQTVVGVSDSVNHTVNGATGALEQTVSGTLNQTQQVVQDTLNATGQAAGGLLEPVTAPTANSVDNVVNTVDQVVKDANVIVNESVDIPLNTLPQVTGAVNGKAADPVGTLLEETGQTIKAVEQTVKNTTGNASGIVESVESVTEGTGTVIGGVVETVTEPVKEAVKPVTPKPSVPPIVPVKPKPTLPEKEPGKSESGTPVGEPTTSSPNDSTAAAQTPVPEKSSGVSSDASASQGGAQAALIGQVVNVESSATADSEPASFPENPEKTAQASAEPTAEPEPIVSAAGYALKDVEESVTESQDTASASNVSADIAEDGTDGLPANAATSEADSDRRQTSGNGNSALSASDSPGLEPTEKAAQKSPLAPREGRQPQAPIVPGLLSENAPARGSSGSSQSGSGSAGPQPPIAQLYTGFVPAIFDSSSRLKSTSDTEGSQWINAPPFSPPKQAPFLT
ncbi:hypothetical protein [Saccharibacillus sacchari]|uniref:Uncharacterized protein n=1 Tax=Saccharibacillus sacchari TaxID=456493 RepID=A0ACC6P9R3_9BACL